MLKISALIGVLCFSTITGALADAPAGWERVVVSKGDVHLEVFKQGNQSATVIMHPSLGRSALDFEQLGNQVVDAGYQVIMMNPRGIGSSKGPMETIKLTDLGKDVWMVADHFASDKVYILGQNFGNRVCRTASSLQPKRVIGLILMAAGGEIEPDKATWAEFEKVFDPSLSPERHLQAVSRSFFAPGNDASAWKDGWYSKTANLQVAATKRTDFAKFYGGGSAPGLVIQGLDDKIAPPQNGWNLVSKRPNTQLVAFPNMGHAMLPEQPKALSDAVISFLDRVR